MDELHAILRPTAANVSATATTFRGRPIETLAAEGDWNGMTLPASYEQLEAALLTIPRMYVEPDGSFGWVSTENPERKLCGQITDNGSQVLFIEIRATCRFEELSLLLHQLGWPENSLSAQVLPEAIMVSIETLQSLMDVSQSAP